MEWFIWFYDKMLLYLGDTVDFLYGHWSEVVMLLLVASIMVALHYVERNRLRRMFQIAADRELKMRWEAYTEELKGNRVMEFMTHREREAYERVLAADAVQDSFDRLYLDGKMTRSRALYWCRRIGHVLSMGDLVSRSEKVLKEQIRERMKLKEILYKRVEFPDETKIGTAEVPVPADALKKPVLVFSKAKAA